MERIKRCWEDMISLNSFSAKISPGIGNARDFHRTSDLPKRFDSLIPQLDQYLRRDTFPIPATEAREGYWGADHFAYWLSGLHDYKSCMKMLPCRSPNASLDYLDFGAASGRITRHFACQELDLHAIACDINLRHVQWINKNFGEKIKAFHNNSIPHLPFEDNSFDLITAFSVFSHIEAFDQAWILELRRILRPGGYLLITANVDNWQDVNDKWPVYKGIRNHESFSESMLGRDLETDKLVFRWHADGSYSSIVFLTRSYLEAHWGVFMPIRQVQAYFTQYQSGVLMQKESRSNCVRCWSSVT